MPVTIKVASHGAASVRQAQSSHITTPKELLDEVAPSLGMGCIDIIQSSFDGKRSAGLLASSNGFVHSVTRAYSGHHHLTIRPEDVWFAILTQLGIYFNEHSEELRGQFVSHLGKKLEIIRNAASRYDVDMGEFDIEMGLLLSKNVVDEELRDWIMPAFTTTTIHDNVVASIIMMGSMEKYFKYGLTLQCGIPSVTLQGTKADWQKILGKLDKLRAWGAETTQFYWLLKPVITRFIQCFERPGMKDIIDFWQQVVSRTGGGCGPDYYSGWITAFCFWDANGTCLYNRFSTGEPKFCLDGVVYHMIETDKVPRGWMSVPVRILEPRQSYNTMMVAGSVGIQCTRSGLSVTDGGSGDLDSISPKVGWWMFEIGSDKEAAPGPGTKRVSKSPPAGHATVGASAAGSLLGGRVKSLLRRREARSIANQVAPPFQLNMSLPYRLASHEPADALTGSVDDTPVFSNLGTDRRVQPAQRQATRVTYKAGYSQPGQALDSRAHFGAQRPGKVDHSESLSRFLLQQDLAGRGDHNSHFRGFQGWNMPAQPEWYTSQSG